MCNKNSLDDMMQCDLKSAELSRRFAALGVGAGMTSFASAGAAALLLVCGSARADVTLEERLSTQGTGVMSIANMQGKTVTRISGNRARTESDLQMQSRLVNMFNRGGPTAQIVRLDEDKVFDLQVNKKTYTETNLEEQRARMQKLVEQQRQAQGQQQQAGSGVDESKCEWSPPKVDVKRSGETGTFAGLRAERVLVSAVQSCKVKNSTQVCDFALSFDQWVAPNFDGNREALAYQRAFAEKMGLTAAASRDVSERVEAMFGRYEELWRELGIQLKDVKGYPVKSSMGFSVGGPQCQGSSPGDGGAPAGARGGGLAGQLGGALGGLIGRKRDRPADAQPAEAPVFLPNGLVPLITVTSELLSVSHDPIPAQAFEVPADFRKTEAE